MQYFFYYFVPRNWVWDDNTSELCVIMQNRARRWGVSTQEVLHVVWKQQSGRSRMQNKSVKVKSNISAFFFFFFFPGTITQILSEFPSPGWGLACLSGSPFCPCTTRKTSNAPSITVNSLFPVLYPVGVVGEIGVHEGRNENEGCFQFHLLEMGEKGGGGDFWE